MMAKVTDIEIRSWIKSGERFEGRSVGDGLYLRFRAIDTVPTWRYRYRFQGNGVDHNVRSQPWKSFDCWLYGVRL